MDVAKNAGLAKADRDKSRRDPDRDAVQDPLFAPVDSLKGIGPRLASTLARLLVGKTDRPARRLDLLLHLPQGVIDHDLTQDASTLNHGTRATLELAVLAHRPPTRRRLPHRVTCALGRETGRQMTIQLVFFQARPRYLMDQLPVHARRVVSGTVTRYRDVWQIVHPDLITSPEALDDGRWLRPVYPSTQGLPQKTLTRAIQTVLDDLPELAEWQDPAWLKAKAWPGVGDALERLHRPRDPADLEISSKPRTRLAYDELLALQLSLALSRDRNRDHPGRPHCPRHDLRRAMIDALPFRLTPAQAGAVREIDADMARPEPMLRLLQGDVGSGKTVVAAIAMLRAIEAGAQAALMAPTDLLARQHAQSIRALLAATGVDIALLTGRERGRARRHVLDALQSGEARAVIGTHALFQDDVEFADLGLAVIDEQHRFGVDQRIELARKGPQSDVLVMTATPIPRTLVLSFYGDIAMSELRQKPDGRQPVQTRVLPIGKLDQTIDAVGRAMARGEQVYWVCPLVAASGEHDMVAAEDRFEILRRRFGGRVGLVHGQMPAADKDRAMAAFAKGDLRILVATTVIEVGVDVPAATVMVIEHAERFGLAQLHQLRGRVGRGASCSNCLLLYAEPLGGLARARLDVMRRTEDGFVIAEEDLRLRGPGEVLGTRQSGLPMFRFADLAAHADLLSAARDDAKLILARDPRLETTRGRALRTLLRWFEHAAAVAYLRSG